MTQYDDTPQGNAPFRESGRAERTSLRRWVTVKLTARNPLDPNKVDTIVAVFTKAD